MKRDRRRIGTPTQRALARMLGSVPSGGAVDVDAWLTSGEVTTEVWSSSVDDEGVETATDVNVELNTFHYLDKRLVVAPTMTAWLQRFGWRDGGDWWTNMTVWAKQRHTDTGAEYWGFGATATINVETALDTDLEVVTFTAESGLPMAAIRVSDGGTGRPYVFEVTSDEPYDFFDWDMWGFGHRLTHVDTQAPIDGMPALPPAQEHAWDRESGPYGGWVEYGGSSVRLGDYAAHGHLSPDNGLVWAKDDKGVWSPRCPLDGQPCDVWAPPTW